MINSILNSVLPAIYDNELSDAVHLFTGTRALSTSEIADNYDPITDQYYDAPDGTIVSADKLVYGGRGTVRDYTDLEIQSSKIDITDIKLSALRIEVTGEPRIGDIITVLGQRRRVMQVGQSSTGVKWVMQLRGLNVV